MIEKYEFRDEANDRFLAIEITETDIGIRLSAIRCRDVKRCRIKFSERSIKRIRNILQAPANIRSKGWNFIDGKG